MSLQIHAWRATSNMAAGATNFISPINGQIWTSTEHRGTVICASAGTFSNWTVVLPTAPGAGKTFVFTLRKNAVDTAAVITITGTATSGSYTPSITVADGDELTIKCVPSGTPAVSALSVTWDFNSTTSAESVYGMANTAGPLAALTRVNRVLSGVDESNWAAGSAQDVVGCSGSITKVWIKLDADVTSGSRTFTITKNGVSQDGTAGTPDTRITFTTGITKASATFTMPVSPGDLLTWSATLTGSPATVRPITGVRLVATTAGQSHFGQACPNITTIGTTQYHLPGQGSTAVPDATESNRTVTLGITGFILRNFQGKLNNTAGGTGSDGWTLNLRKNNADASNSVTILNGATTGSNSSSTTFAAGDQISMQSVSVGTSTARTVNWGFIQEQTSTPSAEKSYAYVDETWGIG